MTNEKWEQIKEVFDAAWQRTPDERARFLDEACGTDETMRREVESLLSSFDGAGSFMAKPIVGETPGSAIPRVTVMPGFQLGTYRIEERLGEGGMGIVYRALDTKLNRPAAVKFLSADLADTSARRRFQREAQTASSLNHPHILTVYDAGEFEGRQYLITEFVDGGTLKSWVADLESGQRQRLLPDFLMQHYSISADGRRIVFCAVNETGRSPVWLASLNGRTPPQQLTTMDSVGAFFGAPGEVVFPGQEKDVMFIYRIKEDGSGLQKMIPTPMLIPFGVSPDGRWVPAQTPNQYGDSTVYPAGGSSPTRICADCSQPQGVDIKPPPLKWTPDGKFVYLKFAGSTYAIPLKPGQMLPPIPPLGFPSKDTVAALPGAQLVSNENVFPGPAPSIYAFTKVATQRNIYRVPVP